MSDSDARRRAGGRLRRRVEPRARRRGGAGRGGRTWSSTWRCFGWMDFLDAISAGQGHAGPGRAGPSPHPQWGRPRLGAPVRDGPARAGPGVLQCLECQGHSQTST
jgi:hypothetical protein